MFYIANLVYFFVLGDTHAYILNPFEEKFLHSIQLND